MPRALLNMLGAFDRFLIGFVITMDIILADIIPTIIITIGIIKGFLS